MKKAAEKQSTTPTIDPESLATFKISAGSGEQATKDALILPYERFVQSFQLILFQISTQFLT